MLGAGGRADAMDVDVRMRRTDSRHASDTLPLERVGPGQVEVHDDAGILQVDAFREDVGRDQQADRAVRGRWGASC